MNILDGTVIGHNMQRHRHQAFIRFLTAVERGAPAGKTSTPSPEPPQTCVGVWASRDNSRLDSSLGPNSTSPRGSEISVATSGRISSGNHRERRQWNIVIQSPLQFRQLVESVDEQDRSLSGSCD
jgi:hypothetical protein